MKKNIVLILILSVISTYTALPITQQNNHYEFAVIGAGPAGMSAVGVLLDNGIVPEKIAWIDPEFGVGRLGKAYGKVPSNTKIKGTLKFLSSCQSFARNKQPRFKIEQYNPNLPCSLSYMTEPLQWISTHLQSQVPSLQALVTNIETSAQGFTLTTSHQTITAKKVILATGSHPKQLTYAQPQEIALDIALNPELLAQAVTPDDSVTVFGSSHSAILVLKNLAQLPIKRIINFYKKPLIYAVNMGNWYLHDNTGLKETAALWAHAVLEKNPPKNLERYKGSASTIAQFLPSCTKVIYAIGFERNEVPGLSKDILESYNATTGIIAPNLFGLGIAFPKKHKDPLGNTEFQIGILDFLLHAQRVIPLWIAQ